MHATSEAQKGNTYSPEIIFALTDTASANKLMVGWFWEAAGAIGVVLLSIVGLVGIFSMSLAAIAAITLGAALLSEGVALALCFAKFGKGQSLMWAGATIGKWVGGVGGILVGLLVLLKAAAPALLPVAVLIFGAAFLFTSMISHVPVLQEIVGAIAFGLGLLAISGLHSMTLVLVALLGLGVTTLCNDVTGERRISTAARDQAHINELTLRATHK